MRKLLLFFAMLCVSIGTWAYNYPGNSASDVKDFGDGKTVCFYDDGSDTQQLVVGAGGLAEWFNDATIDKSYLSSTSRTKLVVSGTLNADDIAAIKTYFGSFTTVDMEGATLEEGASVAGMQLPNAEYMALPHGTPIADMKTLKSGCPKLKAVAATDAASPTQFTGYSWAAGEIYNICQKGLVDGIAAGNCANEMSKLTIGGNVDDRDASTLVGADNVTNEKSAFSSGSAQYSKNEVMVNCSTNYIAPTHSGSGYSPWKGDKAISLDFTEALFENKGDIALVSAKVTELLLPVDPTFTVINPFMFAELNDLEHIIIPNNIVTIGDGAFFCNGNVSKVEEISIGNGIKTIGNAAFAARGRSYLTDVRFAAGISDVKILANVFSGCTAIKHMTLPQGIVSLGESCFEMLSSLESVHLPSTLQYIGINCFKLTGLTSVTIPKSVKIIDYHAFDLCRITDIYLMAENVAQIPYIFAQNTNYSQADAASTFGSNALNGNNTTPPVVTKVRDTEPMASKSADEGEEYFRLSVKDGNTIARLHYDENLESFINLNPWYFPGETTQKPASNTFSGQDPYANGGIVETEGLSNTFYLKDKENGTYPEADAGDLARPSWAAYFNSNSHKWDETVSIVDGNQSLTSADYSFEDGSSLQTPYYNHDTGELIPFTEVTTHVWKVLRKEGWRQFTFRAGDAASEDIVFKKMYQNVWYTMCFPFSLTDEQLETAFNAEYNIADFSGIEVNEKNENGNKEIILHFNKIAQPKYYDQDHNEYQRVPNSKEEYTIGRSVFNVYEYKRGDDTYKYVKTYSNKSYAKNGEKDNGIVYIDGYLAQAGHPYMIHPNLGTAEGAPAVTANMVGINYYSRDPQVIDQLCKEKARSVDLGTGKGYEGVSYTAEDASDIEVNTENEVTENFAQAAYSKYSDQTYSFVGNCNEYTADAPAYPSLDNDNAKYRLEALPSIEDFVDAKYLPNGPVKAEQGPEPSQQDVIDAVGARQTAADEPQAPTFVANPADDTTTYPANFQTVYNAAWENSTMGELIIANNDPLSVGAQAYWNGGFVMYNTNNPLTAYFGNSVQFQQSDYNALQSLCSQYKSALNSYNSYATLYAQYKADHQVWQDNMDAWAAYDAAYAEWNSFDEEQAQADYDAAMAEYGSQVGAYNGEVTRVNNANNGKITQWRNDVKAYAVYIPYNSYFLSRNAGEYYTHFFREKASLSSRKAKGTGKWSRYTAVLIPNAAALAGVETAQDPSGAKAYNMAFDEPFYAVEATEIEKVVEEAKEKGQSVQYVDVVVSIDGKVVRRGNTSLEGLPSGIYIINGKKYFVK